jgi:hypothetical protein
MIIAISCNSKEKAVDLTQYVNTFNKIQLFHQDIMKEGTLRFTMGASTKK